MCSISHNLYYSHLRAKVYQVCEKSTLACTRGEVLVYVEKHSLVYKREVLFRVVRSHVLSCIWESFTDRWENSLSNLSGALTCIWESSQYMRVSHAVLEAVCTYILKSTCESNVQVKPHPHKKVHYECIMDAPSREWLRGQCKFVRTDCSNYKWYLAGSGQVALWPHSQALPYLTTIFFSPLRGRAWKQG